MTSFDKKLQVRDLRTFVGAKDFEVSRDFYIALGWRVNFDEGEIAELELCGQCFYLQRYYHEDWCNNSMLHLTVEDATAWYEKIESVLALKSYGNARTKPPIAADYAKFVTHMWDPSDVLWHLAQLQ